MPATKWIYQQLTACCVSRKNDGLFDPDKDVINDNRYHNNKNKFSQKIKKIIWQFREDHDRGNFLGNGHNFSPMSALHSEYTLFLQEVNEILRAINSASSEKMAVSDDGMVIEIIERDREKWFEANCESIGNLLNCLAHVYERRTPWAKGKDIAWQALDVIIFSCVMAGVSLVAIKTVPLIATWIALHEGAKISIVLGSAAIGCFSSLLYKIFNDEKHQIESAIQQDVKMKFGN